MTKLVVWIAGIVCIANSSVVRADKVFRAGKGATWDCNKDPIVSIEHGNATYTLKGSCKSINLTGGNNTLTIETTGSINVTGAHNKIAIDTVDSINIVGSENTVTYRGTAHGGAPSVSKIGTNNVVTTAARPRSAASPPVAASPPATALRTAPARRTARRPRPR
jgi:hypothetical protein